MAINEQDRQLDVAREAEELLRTLAHSTRDVPRPRDSYSMLGELDAIIDHVAQVCDQLASWHSRVEDGKRYEGEDGNRSGSTTRAADNLIGAASALRVASDRIRGAHSHNSVVRWYDEVYDEPQEG